MGADPPGRAPGATACGERGSAPGFTGWGVAAVGCGPIGRGGGIGRGGAMGRTWRGIRLPEAAGAGRAAATVPAAGAAGADVGAGVGAGAGAGAAATGGAAG